MPRAHPLLPLAIALLLGGCLASATPTRESADVDAAAAGVPTPSALGLGEHAMEPHVAVRAGEDGLARVVVANMADVRLGVGKNPTTQIEIHRSADGGATWTSALLDHRAFGAHDPLGVMGFSGDAVLAYAPGGTLYLAGVAARGPIETLPLVGPCCLISDLSVFVLKSEDDGASWSPPLLWRQGVGPAPVGPMQDKEWIAVGPDGDVHFGWTEFTSFPMTTLRYTRSVDGGATWSADTILASTRHPGDDLYSGLTLAAADDGRVYASYSVIPRGSTAAPGRQVAIHSEDGGLTWSAPVDVGASWFPRYGQVVAAPADPLRAHVLVADADQRMTVATTRDGGASWTTAAPLASGRAGPQPLGAGWIDQGGLLHVVHYDASWPAAGGGVEERAVVTIVDADGALVAERAISGAIDPAERRREYLGAAGAGDVGFAAWIGGAAATGTHVEVGALGTLHAAPATLAATRDGAS